MTHTIEGNERLIAYPTAVAQEYFTAGVWADRTLGNAFRAIAQQHADREALVCGSVRLTYRELDELSDLRAAGFHRLGLLPGGAVLVQLNNTADTVVTWYALIKAGLVPVCTLPLHRRHEISEIGRQTAPVAHIVDADSPGFDLVAFAVEQSDAAPSPRMVIAAGSTVPAGVVDIGTIGRDLEASRAKAVVLEIQSGLGPQDVAVFQLSGGTTGVPKVIPRLHAEYWYNAEEYARVLGWTQEERVAYIGPVVHNAGIVCGVHGPHSVGAAAILGTPVMEEVFDLLEVERATDIVLGPFAYDAALDPRLGRATNLKRVLFSGKKVPRHHFDALEARNVWAGQLFGMGEGLCMITPLGAPPEVRATSVGVPISEWDEVRILDPGSEDKMPPGVVGELCARGPYTLRGYYDAPEHNARAFTSDGFYRSGDLAIEAVIDGERCFTIEGRIKDLINRGGEKINAEEVELLLVSHPDIIEAALVAMPDDRLGERACAFVVGLHGVTRSMAEMRDYFDSLGVAKYKWPERIVWLDEMPRASQVGKIDKRALRADAASLRPEPR